MELRGVLFLTNGQFRFGAGQVARAHQRDRSWNVKRNARQTTAAL
jgi:hypothetical protein